MNHTFRVAFRAGGKEDNGIIFRLLLNLRQTRHQQVRENPQLVGGRDVCFQIFQEHPAHLRQLFRQVPQLAFIQELAGGKDGVDLCCGNRAGEPFHARRVVHHRRNAAPGHGTKDYRRADTRVWQHQADLFALFTVLFQNTPDKQRFGQQLTVGIWRKTDVFDAVFLRTVAILRRQQRFIQRFARANGHARFHHNLVQHFSGDFSAVARTRRLGHRQ